MIETQPSVYLLAEPMVDHRAMREYLREVGGEAWYKRVVAPIVEDDIAGATSLIEFCGRLCYRSWEPGLNKNVSKIREDTAEYLLNILTVGHGSVIEHAHFTFVLHNVSRVLTAELNRHRHPNISEQSLRYVRLDEAIPFRMPPVLKEETQELGRKLIREIESYIGRMYEIEGIDSTESFHEKKTITSAIRRFAPMGMSTEEVWTANLRDIRHIIETRTAPGAEEEIRLVAHGIGTVMAERAPFFFSDYKLEYVHSSEGQPPHWVTPNKKV